MSEGSLATLSTTLRLRAGTAPDREAYVFLRDGEEETERLSWGELDRRARAIAGALLARCSPGDRALLLLPSGLDFAAAFFGCLYAGVVAVPADPPRPRRDRERLRALVCNASPRLALTTSNLLAGLQDLAAAPEWAGVSWLPVDSVDDSDWDGPDPDPGSLAFLQYTSGSTALPKGVRVTHANLVHNERMIAEAFGQDEGSVVVGWLPLYHDMGLIGNVLQPLWSGGRCVLMSPGAFLQRPRRWLEAITRYRATTSGGPSFAYDLCVRRIGAGEREGLDLSSWRVAFNGAEPVRAETLERFTAAFAGCGFRREAFYPCYGLAEATLFVAGGERGREARVATVKAAALERHEVRPADGGEGARHLVSCGRPWQGQRLAVVDPETGRELPAGQVGEIWVSGPSVGDGYWGHPAETERDFGAALAGGGPERFLRTGDLGFVSGGELFITGRLKDLIILRGRNLYPQDVELTAERSHPDLHPGGGAAFAVEVDGEERLVVVHEVERRREGEPVEPIVEALRRAVAEEHEAQIYEVVLVRAGAVPRTSSGKVRRGACRAAYRAGELAVVGRSALHDTAPSGAAPLRPAALRSALIADERLLLVQGFLRRTLAGLLGIDPGRIEPDQPLTALGLDSVAAVELKAAAEDEMGAGPAITALLEGITLSEAAQQVIEAISAGRSEPVEPEPATPAEDSAGRPLSWGQKSLWLVHRLAPGSAAYHLAGAARLPAGVDLRALERALQGLVDRHEALRTTYADGPDGPAQHIHSRGRLAFVREDASGWSAEELRQRIAGEAFRPFDLARGPVFRAALFTGGPGGDHLVLSVHHIAADLWSLAVLLRELGELYRGQALPAPRLQPRDHALWQERMLAGPQGERLFAYWQERLGGVPPLDLPADRPRPPFQGFRGASRRLRLPASDLHALAQGRGTTPFMALFAAFSALLARYSGQDDFLAGVPTSGRAVEGLGSRLAGVVGYLVNPVALRADLTGEPTGAELLERTRRAVLDAFAHQDLPFGLLAGRLQPERDPSRPALVQVMLAFEKAPAPGLEGLAALALGQDGERLSLEGLELEPVALEAPGSQLDLELLATESAGGLLLSLRFDSDLFDAATADRMLGHLAVLLGGLAADPAARVRDLPPQSEAERAQLNAEWNDTAHSYPRERCVPELFTAQAERTPDAVAAVDGELFVTYGELARRSGALAWWLVEHGIGSDVVTPLAVDRGSGFLTAVLAVFEAGGSYLPLDTSYPRQRLAQVIGRSRAALVLAGERHRPALAAALDDLSDLSMPARPHLLALEESPTLPGASRRRSDPANLAYVIFTSGSTGIPKGAMVEHRGMLNHLFAKIGDLRLTEADVVAQTASTSFDISVWQFLASLLVGGRTEILGDGVTRDPGLLLDELERRRVSVFETVPSMLAALLDEIERRADHRPTFSALRWLILTGEALPPELCRYWLSLYPRVSLLNAYGPTECADDVTHMPLRRPPSGGVIPIGRPIGNTRIRILDRGMRPVPLGIVGELCVGGDGVGRGYLGEPGRTAEVFVPDVLVRVPGERLYRTGDLARQRSDGTLEFLGRIDHQVKVRGFRIELGEIETALARHPAVREAAVVVREDARGQRLVGYFTPWADAQPAARELRDFLARELPEYMVPSAFVRLTAFPLTPNGKLDRKALPPPDDADADGEGFELPTSPYQELLAGIWRQVLGRERVGIHESFFELGGHSLLATQVVSRVRGTLGVELPLRTLFERPTIAGLAGAVEELRAQGAGRAAPPISPVPRTGELPLSFAQERLWFLDQLQPGSTAYNIPSALGLRGRLSRPALAASLGRIVARHESLRTTFVAVDGRAVQAIQPAPNLAQGFALPLIDLRDLPAERRDAEAAHRIREEVRQPFDLACGPLLRATLLELEEGHHIALVTLHHIVSDGWSTGVLVRELSAAYAALAAGCEPSLPELPVQYADFAVWQRQWLSGEVLDEQLAWWRDHLAGAPALLDLPLDRPRPPLQSLRGDHLTAQIPARLSLELEALARAQGATLFMLLLAAFQGLLSRLSGQEEVVVGSPVANRNRQETEGLIGFFANTLALRGDIGETSFTDLLRRTREVTLGAYAHQDLPFEKLVDELQPVRSLAHSPVFQVMLVLQNAPVGSLVLPGLRLEPVASPSASAKFDLTLVLTETAQGLEAVWERAADLLDATTVARLAGHFLTLLAGVVTDPERRISELPLLTESERAQLAEWNQTEEDLPQVCLHWLFEAQAGRTPDAVAAVCGGARWTYRELDGRANRLAHRLVGLGVGPEVLVGLCLERSLDLLAAILAVLKAGGAYVPLDPDYPAERLKLMLEDSGARTVITREALVDRMSVPGVLPLVLDRDEAPLSPESAEVPRVASEPRNLAYLIYTSGSTGRPKGVGIEHRSASVLVHWAQREFADPEIAGVLAATSICFDLSVFEIFVPLSRGGKVILAQNALELPDLAAAAEVTLVNTVPSAIGALARQRGIPPLVRTVCLAGEPLRRALVQEVYGSSAASRVLNLYGPTEDTTYSTWTAVDRESGEEPTIGRPIAGSRVQILDASLRPTPVGAPGELCLAGAGLARGYLGRPDLTGEKFVPDPESELRGEPGGRLYRTGDLARWRPDGAVQLLGRLDGQVKVRGFRIELGEIEAALRDHPDVHEAAVLARGEGANRSLVAYVSPAHLSPATLRAFLGRRLPEPMVPTSWVTLPALPLSPNGKIDRRALPEPEPPRRAGEEDRPRTAAERRLAAIWAEVLGLDRIGVHDNFFALGGDSILSIQVVGRAARAGLRITPRQMFWHPTIAERAAAAE